MFKKTIISEFFTTVSFSQMMQSLYLIFFRPFSLKYGKEKEIFEKKLLDYIYSFSLGGKDVGKTDRGKIISFYNGRSAIYHALKIIGVKKDDEIIVSAYNCSVVVNAVLQSGGKIKYADIEPETLGLDFEFLQKIVTPKTKVIILQHTFGKISRDYEKIIDFAKKNNILVIEDCAHYIPLSQPFPPREKGVLKGDFAIFSTGRDKVISSVTGGFLVINNEKYIKPHPNPLLQGEGTKLSIPSTKLILQNLMYNIIGYKAYKLYDFFKLGRIIIFLSRKLNLITEILDNKEKNFSSKNFNLAFPNALAYLAIKELEKLDEYTKIRLENAKYYLENIKNPKIKMLPLLEERAGVRSDYNGFRFPILLNSIEEKNKLYNLARKNNIILGKSWSGKNIVPAGVDLGKAQYKIGTCPVAEDISSRILTLPNHKFITKKDLDRVIEVLNNF